MLDLEDLPKVRFNVNREGCFFRLKLNVTCAVGAGTFLAKLPPFLVAAASSVKVERLNSTIHEMVVAKRGKLISVLVLHFFLINALKIVKVYVLCNLSTW